MTGFKNRRKNKVVYLAQLPCYEKDYLKAPLEPYYLIDEYMDMGK